MLQRTERFTVLLSVLRVWGEEVNKWYRGAGCPSTAGGGTGKREGAEMEAA